MAEQLDIFSENAQASMGADGRWKRYPAYKDSGIEWLGEIPEHWEVKRLRHAMRCLDGRRIPLNSQQRTDMQGQFPYWGANGIVDHLNEWLFDEPLVLLGEDGAPFFERLKDVAFFVSGKIWVNNHIHVLRPADTVEPHYLTHMLNITSYRPFIDGTTRDKLTQEKMNDIPVLAPPVPEQGAIADFLDRETARIDALIEKKERQVELLQEKRTALISQAVTKGLDPTVPMKDPGIEWLGGIPEHWDVMRLKNVLWLQRGHDLPSTDFGGGDYPVCGSNGCIGYHDRFTTKGPGVTVGRSGSIGEVNYVRPDYWAHNTALYVKEFRRTEPRYAFYLLETLDVKHLGEGTAVGTLNRNHVHRLRVAIPDAAEQRTIAAFLDRETARVDALAEKLEKSIATLREYRTALISAAVTGKIDVREEVT